MHPVFVMKRFYSSQDVVQDPFGLADGEREMLQEAEEVFRKIWEEKGGFGLIFINV